MEAFGDAVARDLDGVCIFGGNRAVFEAGGEEVDDGEGEALARVGSLGGCQYRRIVMTFLVRCSGGITILPGTGAERMIGLAKRCSTWPRRALPIDNNKCITSTDAGSKWQKRSEWKTEG